MNNVLPCLKVVDDQEAFQGIVTIEKIILCQFLVLGCLRYPCLVVQGLWLMVALSLACVVLSSNSGCNGVIWFKIKVE